VDSFPAWESLDLVLSYRVWVETFVLVFLPRNGTFLHFYSLHLSALIVFIGVAKLGCFGLQTLFNLLI